MKWTLIVITIVISRTACVITSSICSAIVQKEIIRRKGVDE